MPVDDHDEGQRDDDAPTEDDGFADLRDDRHDQLFDEIEARQPHPVATTDGVEVERGTDEDRAVRDGGREDADGTFRFDPHEDDELLDQWADEGQFESLEPRRNWSNAIAVLLVLAVLGAAVLGGWALLQRSEDADEATGGSAGQDAEAGSVLDEDLPSLDELTSDVTLPPGPSEGLLTHERGVTVVEDRFDASRREGTYAVLIDNPHADWLAQGVQISVTFLGADGSPLGSDSGFVEVVLPGQRVAVASLFFDAPTEPVVDLAVEIDVARWRETEPFEGSFAITEVETSAAEYSGVVTRFDISSRFDEPLTDVAITAVYRDAEGRIIGGYDTFVELLEPGVPTAAEIALLANVEVDDVASTELYPVATFGFVPGE